MTLPSNPVPYQTGSEKVPTDIKLLLLEELKGEIIVETGMKVTQGREDIWHYRQLTEKAIFCDPLRETLLRHRKIKALGW